MTDLPPPSDQGWGAPPPGPPPYGQQAWGQQQAWQAHPVQPGPGLVGGQRYSLSSDERTMGMLSHLLGLFSFLGPLVIFLTKGKESSFVRDQAAEALNFQLTLLLAYVVSMFLMLALIGFLLVPAVFIVHIVYGIIATMRANEGIAYRYPICIRLVS